MINAMLVQIGDRISIPVMLIDSTSRPSGKTGIAFGSVTVNYIKITSQTASSNTRTSYTPVSADWSEVDATNTPGIYMFQLPAAMVNTAGTLVVRFSGTGFDDYRALLRVVPWTQGNIRITAAKADNAIAARNVAAGALSHVKVEVKSETASDWTTVIGTYYTVFAYFGSGDIDSGAYTETKSTAPSETTFTYSTAA